MKLHQLARHASPLRALSRAYESNFGGGAVVDHRTRTVILGEAVQPFDERTSVLGHKCGAMGAPSAAE